MSTEKKKTCSIALMSGKGGSGKTTLALSMASLLSSCGVKTLLVDCDLSTNGATYFFEDEMSYYSRDIDSLHQIIQTSIELNLGAKISDCIINLYPVNKFFDFFPSVTQIRESWSDNSLDTNLINGIRELLEKLALGYDVVLYDCQAGYTKLLEAIIPVSDRNLMVLEADSISASAVRNLYLKLNQVWGTKKIYQIFSKATEEEEEIYSKVTTGTLFDNIGCIRFDWTVRKAFAVSRIPDMVHTSADYGKQVCNLCDNLIRNPLITQKINQFILQRELEELKIKKNEKIKEYNEMNQYMEAIRPNHKLYGPFRSVVHVLDDFFESLMMICLFVVGLITIIYSVQGWASFGSDIRTVLLAVASVVASMLLAIIVQILRNKRSEKTGPEKWLTDTMNDINVALRQINKQIYEHEEKLKNYENDVPAKDNHNENIVGGGRI